MKMIRHSETETWAQDFERVYYEDKSYIKEVVQLPGTYRARYKTGDHEYEYWNVIAFAICESYNRFGWYTTKIEPLVFSSVLGTVALAKDFADNFDGIERVE